MPFEKFRDIGDVPPMVLPPLRPQNLRIAFELSMTAMRLKPTEPFRGIKRFPPVERSGQIRDDRTD